MSYKNFVLNKLNTSATQTYLQESVDNLMVVDNQNNLSSGKFKELFQSMGLTETDLDGNVKGKDVTTVINTMRSDLDRIVETDNSGNLQTGGIASLNNLQNNISSIESTLSEIQSSLTSLASRVGRQEISKQIGISGITSDSLSEFFSGVFASITDDDNINSAQREHLINWVLNTGVYKKYGTDIPGYFDFSWVANSAIERFIDNLLSTFTEDQTLIKELTILLLTEMIVYAYQINNNNSFSKKNTIKNKLDDYNISLPLLTEFFFGVIDSMKDSNINSGQQTELRIWVRKTIMYTSLSNDMVHSIIGLPDNPYFNPSFLSNSSFRTFMTKLFTKFPDKQTIQGQFVILLLHQMSDVAKAIGGSNGLVKANEIETKYTFYNVSEQDIQYAIDNLNTLYNISLNMQLPTTMTKNSKTYNLITYGLELENNPFFLLAGDRVLLNFYSIYSSISVRHNVTNVPVAYSTSFDVWETLTIVKKENEQYTFESYQGKYLTSDLNFNTDDLTQSLSFDIIHNSDNTFSFFVDSSKQYLSSTSYSTMYLSNNADVRQKYVVYNATPN
jgi:hypothetical protein